RTALQVAADVGNIELVQILLAAGADVNAPAANYAGATSLQAAAIRGYVGIATILLDAGANTNGHAASEQGRTALEGAAEHGRIDMVQLLLNAGAELHGNGERQYRNALELASENGHNAVRRLIEAYYESHKPGI
ncbi:ankyrin, partial [Lepidopterella palustris CBS 459.81]